ncbi:MULTISPECIES: ABC transporter permease [Rhizobium]|uniref:ABC transporter permease n=1 Tax=Rhizobium hidalgonense TaxID=1538159 RepID=A0AAJ2GX36_9HYPH|nr:MULTISPECIES: ABC transporter permease [Rhizobium]ANK95478.1 dipeptide/oligopeptide ABC transporter permease protein [Rhizobium sp. N6212]ANL01530.1 dipeptide/oligopeptide ABC transporter permease protein [Rhizobium sp. N621]ANL07658.1 dipeptide/oligopeptide ABC transporter permease protein [Rhizobium esperanzae]ANL13828.1 dipeptide/oligopeptide ABC transporter permease protein [Rhizobium sp. N1341]ANM38499.1 dipeptide/oligopeptide ABC transporter permease protein [Rhizobium sp. N871]
MFVSSPLAAASATWLLFVLVLAFVVAPLVVDIANHQTIGMRFFAPFRFDKGFAFFLGADSLGRPIMLQLIVGARTSVLIAIFSVGISATIGYTIGLISGYFGGWVDNILLRIADIIHTVPSLLMALVVLFVLQPSILNLVIVLGITRIPVYLRTSRTQTMEVRERMFVEVAKAIGASDWRIITRDIAPLVFPTIRTLAMLEVAAVILSAASLTFLGIGLQRPDVDWGMMVSDGRAYLKSAWFVAVFPGIVIVLTALSANILSNWLRAVEDPAQSTLFFRARKKKRSSSQ